MLHVLNGDETRTVFERAGLPGEVMVWRDILVEGPVDAGSDAVPALDARVAFLAERLAIDRDIYARGARAQAEALDAASSHDEVALWFEQDLFCAVNLWRLLDWFARRAPATRLSLVYPSTDDLKGLGAAQPPQLTALFAGRTPVSEATRALGARAWAAYASADPLDGATLADADDTALPFVRGGPSSGSYVSAVRSGTHSSAISGCARSAGTAANVIVSGQPNPASAWTAHW